MSMEIEQQQSQVIQQFVSQAPTLNASALVSLIVQATSHPSLFAFSEILSLPTILQLQGTENAAYLDLLRLFAYGTWREYKNNANLLPKLVPDQILKLKQLTVLTLAEATKVLSYDKLLAELELSNVRELEDFLINDCMYSGIVKGKLDQLRRCFQVQFAAGRDLMHGQLGSMLETLTNWLDVSNNMLPLIEEKIEWASQMCKSHEDHQKEVQNRIEQAKEAVHANSQRQHTSRGHNIWGREDFYYFPDGEMDHEVDSFRSKRRRSPNSHGRRRPTHH